MNTRTLAIALAALGALSAAAFPEGIAYRGKLQAVNAAPFDGALPITMTFCLYKDAEGGPILWGRRIPVVVAKDGTFDVVLQDTTGSAFNGPEYESLVTAISSLSDAYGLEFYIGLTVGNGGSLADIEESEFKPRQRVGAVPLAERAVEAHRVDRVTGLNVNIDQLHVVDTITTPELEVTGTGPNSKGLVTMSTPTLTMSKNATLYAENGSFTFSGFGFPSAEIKSMECNGRSFESPVIVLRKVGEYPTSSFVSDFIVKPENVTTDSSAKNVIQIVGEGWK